MLIGSETFLLVIGSDIGVKQYKRAVGLLGQLPSAFSSMPTSVIGHAQNQSAKDIFNGVEEWRSAVGIKKLDAVQANIAELKIMPVNISH